MRYPKRKSLPNLSISKIIVVSWLIIIGFTTKTFAEEDFLILEPLVQGFSLPNQDYVYAYPKKDKFYLSIQQMATYIGMAVKENNGKYIVFFQDDKEEFILDFDKKEAKNKTEKFDLTPNDYMVVEDEKFLSHDFLQKFLNISIEIDTLGMRLKFDRKEDFPNIRKIRAFISRNRNGIRNIETDPFSNYKMDDRFFTLPTIDLLYTRMGNKNEKFSSSDYYSATIAGIFAGLDVNGYISGSTLDDKNTTKKLSAGRIFLDDNIINLKTLKMGDINGVSSSFFNESSSGRGVLLSSFKDLVMSADKTIDISGPLADGWEVELYWNDQLVGYRQNGENGEYLFPKIPVSYGLNTFKLIFYGPYGEVKTETKRYYSGTSPVKKGEVGYNFSALQPQHSLFESKEEKDYSDVPIVDMNMYYGATDNTSVMAGISQTQDSFNLSKRQLFSMVGIQTVFQGASLQYNLEHNMDTNKIGHHFELEGDIYIGSALVMYDHFGNLHSPLSYSNNQYLKEQLEARLSGILPFQVLYYFDYKKGTFEDGKKLNSFNSRLSKQLSQNFNLIFENDYKKFDQQKTDSFRLGVFTWKNEFTTETWFSYQILPQKKLDEGSIRLNWRSDRYTYYAGKYTHRFQKHEDNFELSAGRNFKWGGLTASFNTDKKFKNYGMRLTYAIGFGPTINNNIFYSGTSKLTETGTIYTELYDVETNQPIKDVGIKANGAIDTVYSDEDGHAVLTDLSTYEKTILSVDMETLDDLSLKPKENDIKLVLRPGAVNYFKIPFAHYGSLEGQLPNPENKLMLGYQVNIVNGSGETVASSYTDMTGYFIVDDIPYGKYVCVIEKNGNEIKKISNIEINDSVTCLNSI